MTSKTLPRAARLFVLFTLAVSAMAVQADPTATIPGGRVLLAQAVEGTAPGAPPAVGQTPGPQSPKAAIPDVLPGLNKKRVAFWGVSFMATTSLIFVAFGAWAIRRAPKPGQKRPDSYEKKRSGQITDSDLNLGN